MTRRKSNQIKIFRGRTPPRWVYALLGGGGILLILIAIPLTLYLVKQSQEIRKEAAPTAVLSLLPATQTVNLGETFDVQIYLDTGNNPIRGGDTSLNFNPAHLEVVDADSTTPGIQTTPGTIFPDPWVAINQADNTTGQVLLSINTFSSFAGEEGVFGTVKFKAKAFIFSTLVSFNPDPETKITAVGGESVAAAKNSATYQIGLPSTPTPTATVAPLPTVTLTPTPTPTVIPTPTPTVTGNKWFFRYKGPGVSDGWSVFEDKTVEWGPGMASVGGISNVRVMDVAHGPNLGEQSFITHDNRIFYRRQEKVGDVWQPWGPIIDKTADWSAAFQPVGGISNIKTKAVNCHSEGCGDNVFTYDGKWFFRWKGPSVNDEWLGFEDKTTEWGPGMASVGGISNVRVMDVAHGPNLGEQNFITHDNRIFYRRQERVGGVWQPWGPIIDKTADWSAAFQPVGGISNIKTKAVNCHSEGCGDNVITY